jgi:TRAP-type mannitol/chloroaromatic compound transport system permease small subunit
LDGTIHTLLRFSRGIDAVNYRFGVIANYLVLIAALLSAANAGFRYGINGLIALSRRFDFLAGTQALIKV